MKTEKVERKKLSIEEPDIIGKLANGDYGVVERNWYTALSAKGIGRIFYFPIENKYAGGEGKEIEKEVFESQFLPFLSWDFDEWETEVMLEKAKSKTGKSVEIDSGKRKLINKFPPTPENIKKKREELLKKALEAGVGFNAEEIYQKTLPRQLKSGNVYRENL